VPTVPNSGPTGPGGGGFQIAEQKRSLMVWLAILTVALFFSSVLFAVAAIKLTDKNDASEAAHLSRISWIATWISSALFVIFSAISLIAGAFSDLAESWPL
jgi:Mn2+/Fe2+ NRAMP family transporter